MEKINNKKGKEGKRSEEGADHNSAKAAGGVMNWLKRNWKNSTMLTLGAAMSTGALAQKVDTEKEADKRFLRDAETTQVFDKALKTKGSFGVKSKDGDSVDFYEAKQRGKKIIIKHKEKIPVLNLEEETENKNEISGISDPVKLDIKQERKQGQDSDNGIKGNVENYKNNPTSLPGYNPQGKCGFRYNLNGKEILVRFDTVKDMDYAKEVLDVHYMDKNNNGKGDDKKTESRGGEIDFTKFKGYDPSGMYGFKYKGKDVRFDTLDNMSNAKANLK